VIVVDNMQAKMVDKNYTGSRAVLVNNGSERCPLGELVGLP
jgi:hypothetical protein